MHRANKDVYAKSLTVFSRWHLHETKATGIACYSASSTLAASVLIILEGVTRVSAGNRRHE
jgi:hypothetical protein